MGFDFGEKVLRFCFVTLIEFADRGHILENVEICRYVDSHVL